MATSIILPYNKSKELCDQTLTGTGIHSLRVGVEQSAASFTWHITSLQDGKLASLKVYHVGNHADDEVLLFESPTIMVAATTPYTFEVECPGPIRIDVIYNGDISYTIRGKAIDAAIVADQVVTLSDGDDQLKWRADVMMALDYNNELLEKLVNHLRVVTNINKDDGESF